jgi:hypothetical protein
VFLAGAQAGRLATAVDSDLYARALALHYGGHVPILVVCDLFGLTRGDVEEIRAALTPRDITPEALVVACTHTHHVTIRRFRA